MNERDKAQTLTIEAYLDVVKERLEKAEVFKEKYSLFKRNSERIDVSVKLNLETDHKNRTALSKQLHINHETLNKAFEQKKADFSHALSLLEENHKYDLKQVEETLENRKNLNNLKHEKLLSDYNYQIKDIAEIKLKQEQRIEIDIEEVMKKFNAQQKELEKELEQQQEKLAANLEKENTSYTQNHENLKDKVKEKLAATEAKLKDYETKFIEAVKSLEDAYKEAIKPINQEVEELEAVRDKEIKKLKKDFESELNKKKKYRKEAEKINDQTRANIITKEIKQIQKDYTQALEAKEHEHNMQLSPAYESKNKLIKDYQSQFYQLKKEGIQKITMFLNSKQVAKTEEMIETDEVNHTFNIARASYKQKKQAIKLDGQIQTINFNQTKDETILNLDYEKNQLTPNSDLQELNAKYTLDKEKNELQKAMKVAQSVYKKDLNILKANHRLKQEQNKLETARLFEMVAFDHAKTDLDHEKNLVSKDDRVEQMMLDHYYTHAKNYTALKTKHIENNQSVINKEISNRIKQNIKIHQQMLAQAKKDHETMIDTIESTYRKELLPYQETADKLAKEKETSIEDLKKSHQKTLDAKKETLKQTTDKLEKRKHQKALETLLDEQKDALNQLTLSYEKKLEPQNMMINQIKKYRIQSIEEAETLLNHITDQINHMINTMKQLGEKEKETYQAVYYEIKHRADLFQTFQLQRKEDMSVSSHDYLQIEHTRLKEKEKSLERKLTQNINALERNYAQEKKETEDYIEALKENYQKDLETINQAKTDDAEAIKTTYDEEKRRIDLYLLKLKRQYDTNLKKLLKDAENDKANRFDEKSQSEAALQQEITRLNQALEEEKRQKETRKKEIVETYQKQVDALLVMLKKDAIKPLTDKDIPSLRNYIKGDIALDTFKKA